MDSKLNNSSIVNKEFDSIRDEFLSELPARISNIEELLLEYEYAPDNKDLIREVFRIIHSLKGSSTAFNMPELTVILHQYEELIGNNNKFENNNSFIEQSLRFVDHLRICSDFVDLNKTQELKDYMAQFQINLFEANNSIGRALIIDASKSITNKIIDILDYYKVDSTIEHDGITGLNMLIRQHFDLVITSQYMSNIDGLSIISALKAMKIKNQNIPAVLMTSNADNYSAHTDKYSPDYILSKDKTFAPKLDSIIQSIFHFDADDRANTDINKILYIEDDKITQRIFSANISKIDNMQSLIVEDRESVISRINDYKPDVILLDNLLDGFTGKDVLMDIKKSSNSIDTPIIVLTATPQDVNLSGLQKLANVKGVLSKPFHIKSFMNKLLDISRHH